MDQHEDRQAELERLRRAADALEVQRAALGDEAVDTALGALLSQIAGLEKELGSVAARDVGGDDIDVGDVKKSDAVAVGRGAKATKIQAHIVNVYREAPGQPDLDDEAFSRALDRYLEWVAQRYGRLDLRGIEKREQQILSLDLDEIYVSLEATISPDRREERLKRRDKLSSGELGLEERSDEEAGSVDMRELLALSQRLVITGGPGSGKTTYLQLIASSLARALRTGDTAAVERYLGLEGDLPLPIFVPLSEFNRYRREVGPAEAARKGTLLAFISHYLIRQGAVAGLPDDFFERLLLQGQACILLLDGLDEVANERERLLVRRAVENLSDNRGIGAMLVSSRSRAYQGEAVLPEAFRVCAVRPMSPDQVSELVARWCVAAYDESVVKQETIELGESIRGLEELRESRGERRLVDTPLLVTIVAIVHYNERRLPEQRAELYERSVDVLLAERHKAKSDAVFELVDWGGTVREKRGLLAYLAYQMMSAGEESGREVDEFQVESWLRPRFVRLRGEDGADEALAGFIQAMRERGSLLDERGGRYRFIHLTFQEFLCAYYLAETVREVDKIVVFLAEEERVAQAWWRETVLLAAGYLGLKSEETALKLLAALAGRQPGDATALAAAELAGTALLELDSQDAATREVVAGRIVALLTDERLAAANELRALAGRALGWLGDPREDVACETPFMVDISVGPFLMGSDPARDKDAYDDEQPQHQVELPDYRIGRYPVTVAQYARFVQAGGYQERRFWTETGWAWRQENEQSEPANWDDPAWTAPNHPVIGASWYEAVAYCAWLSEETGRRFRLPDEAMWEKAARGGDGRIYPWGDAWDAGRLNSGEDEVSQTTAVGIFPGGRSPFGLYDCSGNVWEWCSGLDYTEVKYPFEQQPYIKDLEARGGRALRGGAFNNYYRWDVRAAVRSLNNPDNRNDDIGFRVVEHLS